MIFHSDFLRKHSAERVGVECPSPPIRIDIVTPRHLFPLMFTVSGQNTIGISITPLVLIQPTDVEQNAINNNWLLKLQPAVKLQSWQKSNFHQIESDLQIHNSDEILRNLICHT